MDGNVLDASRYMDIINHDGSAEWNIYNNPLAAAIVFQSAVPITLIPLDATNYLHVNWSFLRQLAEQSEHSTVSKLAYDIWLVARDQIDNGLYCFWDITTAAVYVSPELISDSENGKIDVVLSQPSEGRTIATNECSVCNSGNISESSRDVHSNVLCSGNVEIVLGIDKSNLERSLLLQFS